MDRRTFLKTAGGTLAVSGRLLSQTQPPRFELEEATINSLQADMRSGRRTARSILELYLSRIDQLDRQGPQLRTIIELNPDALKIADALDAERRSRGARGPLHGIPILLKDNINTAGPMTTTAGSLALEGCIPPREASVAKRMRDAGAIILGKANMSEWANFRSTRSTSGWSARGGQCRNPYVLSHSPLGSSSGCAVAVAANLCAAAVGTETDGSIVSPSSVCGVVGFKPTVGLISTSGIIPVAQSQDTAGPICRTLEDTAHLLSALAGTGNFSSHLKQTGLKDARIGVARNLFVPDRNVDQLMSDALDVMKQQGAQLIDIENVGSSIGEELDVLLYEFKANINDYLAGLEGMFRGLTLDGLIDFNERYKGQELAIFGQEMFLRAQSKGPLTDEAYTKALAACRRLSRKEGIDAALERYKVDAFVAPTCSPAGVIDPGRGDRYYGRAPQLPAVAGYPHVTVPLGLAGELPVGLSFFSGAQTEPILFRLAFGFESAATLRRPPRFLPALD